MTLLVLLPWLLLVGLVRMAITRREPQVAVRQQRAAMDRYVAGWRSWLDWHAGQDGSPDRDH